MSTRTGAEIPTVAFGTPVWRSRLRLARRIGYIVIPLLVAYYVLSAWSLKPVDLNPTFPQAERLQRSVEELVGAARQLPVTNLTADTTRVNWGRNWSRPGTAEALFGTWDTTDPNGPHARVLAFIRDAKTQTALADARYVLARLDREYAPRLTYRHPIRPLMLSVADGGALAELMYACCAAARVATEVDDDPDTALSQLHAGLSIARLLDQLESWQVQLTQLENELIPLDQYTHVLKHPQVSSTAAQATAAVFADDLSFTVAVDDFAGLSRDLEQLLDIYYAAAEDGGQLVVNRAEWLFINDWRRQRMNAGQIVATAIPEAAFWNLGTPLFDRRDQVLEQIAQLRAIVQESAGHPTAALFESDHEHYIVLPDSIWSFGSRKTSGFFNLVGPWVNREALGSIRTVVMRRRATYVMARVAQYRAEKGALPPSLEGLERFLERPLPLDLNTNKSFVYEPSGAHYELKSTQIVRPASRSGVQPALHRSDWTSYLYQRPASATP